MFHPRHASLFSVALGVVLSQGLAAQGVAPRKNRLGLALGLSDYRSRDLLLSPLIYRGTTLAAELHYSHRRTAMLHSVELWVALGDINTRFPSHVETSVRASAAYGLARRVASLGIGRSNATLLLGGAIATLVDGSFPQEFENSYTWIGAHSIAATVSAYYPIGDRRALDWSLHVPLVSYVARPPYAGGDDYVSRHQDNAIRLLTTRGELATPAGYFRLSHRITYAHRLSRRMEGVVRHRFMYHRYDHPRTVESFDNHLAAGLAFGF